VSTLTALARAEAVARGVAQPIATVRHVHVADRPLVLVPLALAGEANAPLAAMVGTAPHAPRLLLVAQPRNRDHRFAFAAALAGVVVGYVDSCRTATEAVPTDRGRDTRQRYADAPQVLVPNGAGVGFVRLLGRSTRFRRPDGDHPVPPSVPLLGRWLTWLAERAEHPGSGALLAVTHALGLHWASGQSAVEDANLATLLAWIDPPAGLDGAAAARAAEDSVAWPPAGPATDPTFDNEVLAPLVAAYGAAAGDAERRRVHDRLEHALAGQLEPTWRLMWRAVELLRAVPPGARVERRWAEDRDAFTAFVEHLAAGGPPQPRLDGAVAAAARLARLERAQAAYDAQRAYDDPLVMAEYRLAGEAFTGEVVAADPNRIDADGPRRKLRPRVTVHTTDPVRLAPRTALTSPARPAQTATVVALGAADGGGHDVVLELSGGMGRSLTPPAGSVPEVGERLCYTTLSEAFQQPAAFPPREETPWTHGGPPPEYAPAGADAVEEWS
jgi:hypothetical protein